jgi:hypothetical protein
MSDDLDTLAPEGREVALRSGQKVPVQPFYFGQWPRAIKLFRPVTEAVTKAQIAGFNGANMTLAPDWPLRLPQVMDEAGESLLLFIAFAISMPRQWFDTLDGDDGIALTKAVFEVNGDFFVRRIAPMLGMSIQPSPQTGAASSPDSSPPATDGQTSSATP